MVTAPYPSIADYNLSDDLTNIFVYVNEVTGGIFVPLTLGAFFIIIFASSYFASMRFQGRGKADVSFAVASFATMGFAVMMSVKSGLLNPLYLYVSIGVSIIGLAWVMISTD